MAAAPRLLTRIANKFPKKWADYWRGVAHDYRHTATTTLEQMKERPGKAAVYIGALAFGCQLLRSNPSAGRLHQRLVEGVTDSALLAPAVRSPAYSEALRHRLDCWNHGTLRTLDLVLLSLAWEDNHNPELKSPRGTVKHLRPKYTDFFQTRVLDVGFLGRWWYLEHMLRDIDVNETAWQ